MKDKDIITGLYLITKQITLAFPWTFTGQNWEGVCLTEGERQLTGFIWFATTLIELKFYVDIT